MSDGLVGVIGGSGLGDALGEHITGGELVEVDTPFGACSSKVMVGQMGGRKIAFINRHGDGHKLMPSEIPYAANIFALKKLGVRALIGSGAVGSLREEIVPGHLVIVDQFIDKTYKRQSTFFEGYGAAHCELAQPTCGRLRKKLFKIAKTIDAQTHDGGTYVCMEGPQFSTRAESLMHQAWGGDLIIIVSHIRLGVGCSINHCFSHHMVKGICKWILSIRIITFVIIIMWRMFFISHFIISIKFIIK